MFLVAQISYVGDLCRRGSQVNQSPNIIHSKTCKIHKHKIKQCHVNKINLSFGDLV